MQGGVGTARRERGEGGGGGIRRRKSSRKLFKWRVVFWKATRVRLRFQRRSLLQSESQGERGIRLLTYRDLEWFLNVRLGPMRPDVLPSHEEELTTHHSDGQIYDRPLYIYIYSFCQHAPGLGLTLTLLACQNPLASYPNETSNSFGERCPIPSLFARSRPTYLHVAFSLFNIRFCNIRDSLYTNLDCYLKLYLLIRSFCLVTRSFRLCYVSLYRIYIYIFCSCVLRLRTFTPLPLPLSMAGEDSQLSLSRRGATVGYNILPLTALLRQVIRLDHSHSPSLRHLLCGVLVTVEYSVTKNISRIFVCGH